MRPLGLPKYGTKLSHDVQVIQKALESLSVQGQNYRTFLPNMQAAFPYDGLHALNFDELIRQQCHRLKAILLQALRRSDSVDHVIDVGICFGHLDTCPGNLL